MSFDCEKQEKMENLDVYDEHVLMYIEELIHKKIIYGLTWQDIADKVYNAFKINRSESWYRHYAKKYNIEIDDPTEDENYDVEGLDFGEESNCVEEADILQALKLEI